MAHRQMALPSHLLQRNATIEIGTKHLFGAVHLPWRQPSSNRPQQRPHATVRLCYVCPKSQQHVIQEQLARLVRAPERREHRPPYMGNRGVVESHGIMLQIADPRRLRVVSYGIEYATRYIKKQVVVRLVEKSDGTAFQVV